MAGPSAGASINGNSGHHYPSASSNSALSNTTSTISMKPASSTPASLSISIQSNNNNNNNGNGHINTNRNGNIPQVDGPVDSSQQHPSLNDVSNDDELGSDLDDDRDEEAELNELEDFVLCTYEKVTRTKNKWRGILKNGIVHIRGRDYVFNRANFEFEW